ncbi:MAG: hypothetical protein HQ596_03215 [Candidatus Saganbacteria bacterium]|nr:hypothetical protein [Candidatus Saganbacteria bacterium]
MNVINALSLSLPRILQQDVIDAVQDSQAPLGEIKLPRLGEVSPDEFSAAEKVYVITHPHFQFADVWNICSSDFYDSQDGLMGRIGLMAEAAYAKTKTGGVMSEKEKSWSKKLFLDAMEGLELDAYLRDLAASGKPVVFVLCTERTNAELVGYLNQLYKDYPDAKFSYIVSEMDGSFSTGFFRFQDLDAFMIRVPHEMPIELSGTYFDMCGKQTRIQLSSIASYSDVSYLPGPSNQDFSPKVREEVRADERFLALYTEFLENYEALLEEDITNPAVDAITPDMLQRFQAIEEEYYSY